MSFKIIEEGAPAPSVSNNQPSKGETALASVLAASTEKKALETDDSSKGEKMISPQYAELARQQKWIRKQQQEIQNQKKAWEEQMKAKEAEYSSNYIPKSQIGELLKKDPYAAFKDWNVSGDELTQALLQQPSPQDRTILELKDEIARLKQSQEKTTSMLSEQEQKAFDSALQQIERDIRHQVEIDPQTWQGLKAFDAAKQAADVIAEYYKETGEILSNEEAMKAVEEDFIEWGLKVAKLPKLKEKLLSEWQVSQTSAAPERAQAQSPNPNQPPVRQTQTLTHQSVPTGNRPLSPRERAILAFQGKI